LAETNPVTLFVLLGLTERRKPPPPKAMIKLKIFSLYFSLCICSGQNKEYKKMLQMLTCNLGHAQKPYSWKL